MKRDFQGAHKYYKRLEDSLKKYPETFFCRSYFLFEFYLLPNLKNFSNNFPKKRFNPVNFIFHIILFILSLITLVSVKIKGKRLAHYMININNSRDSVYDGRINYILDIIDPKDTVNFFHSNSLPYSLKTYFFGKNAFFFESVFYVLKPFIKVDKVEITYDTSKFNTKENEFNSELFRVYSREVRNSEKRVKLYGAIFKFLKTEKLFSLDDNRYAVELNVAAKDAGAKTIAYMHGRFNEFHVGLFYYPYDKYLVWTEYFKKLLLRNSKVYKSSNIVVSGNIRFTKEPDKVDRKKRKETNVLIVGESNIDYDEIIPYYKELFKRKEIKVFFRGKPGESYGGLLEFLKEKNVKIVDENTYFETLENNNIDTVIGTHSTTLFESLLLGIPSVYVWCEYDYGIHMVKDGMCVFAKKPSDVLKSIDKCKNMPIKEVQKMRDTIWKGKFTSSKEDLERLLQ